MTCKDCLHYEACKGTYFTFKQMIDKDSFDKEHYADVYNCPDFTARSERVHLPCKVGDKIYQTDGIRIYESTIQDFNAEYMIWCTESISFDERAIDNGIFLTREEAEKALEGMKEDG